jgi:type IV pilus assembly protein PilY1
VTATDYSAKCNAGSTTSNGVKSTCQVTGPTTEVTLTCDAQTASPTNSGLTISCGTPVTTTGTSNTLADVADYYYKTDLRTTGCSVNNIDVCENIVPTNDQDKATWQHMVTYTLGLGAIGKMEFSPTYLADTSGDYHSVANEETAIKDTLTTIDDLWHAAVDGRGLYFSASNTSDLSIGLSNALKSVQAVVGTSAAATPSNLNVTNGDDFIFSSSYKTQDWTGELIRQKININTGIIDTNNTTNWAAQKLLDNKIYSSRTIYTNSSGLLTPFNDSNFGSNLFFTPPSVTLSQYCTNSLTTCLSTDAQTEAKKPENLINYLRGDRSFEGTYYRTRQHVLGDIVDSETAYVNQPLFHYTDTNFAAHLAAISCRQPMVYVGSGDGMLHAFYATSGPTNTTCSAPNPVITPGDEAWAYIPSLVLSKLYKLADKDYSNHHEFFVDGTPVVNEICSSGCGTSSADWKTILVGGLNQGGRGYYALDITDPAVPELLWEFSNDDLGNSYGNPMITKLTDGTWVVLLTSGYNNVSPGDGIGHLFVLNANTGELLKNISTGIGSTASPSGLAKLNVYATNADVNNTALRAYGGDLLGNLWRFDLDAGTDKSGTAKKVVTFTDSNNIPQPITTKPELGLVNNEAVVFVGTGQFLGISDLSTTQSQSIYAVKDILTSSDTLPSPHGTTCSTITTNCFVQQPASSGTINSVNLVNQYGWFVDLPDTGERANTDPELKLGTLIFNTNIPSVSACTVGGYSEQYQFDYRTGGAINAIKNDDLRHRLGNAFVNRPVLGILPNNSLIAISSLTNGLISTTPISISPISSSMHRLSWRELTN